MDDVAIFGGEEDALFVGEDLDHDHSGAFVEPDKAAAGFRRFDAIRSERNPQVNPSEVTTSK